MRLVLLFLIFVVCKASVVGAEVYKPTKDEMIHYRSTRPLVLPLADDKGHSKWEYFEKSFRVPKAPIFREIQFVKLPKINNLSQRIERLVYGIYTDVNPQYDHYGYEIRRYMVDTANPQFLNYSSHIEQNIEEIKKCRIILDFWKRELVKEMEEIEIELEKIQGVSKMKSTFRFNKNTINGFIPVAYSWLDLNLEYLEFLKEFHGQYFVQYPIYYFKDSYIQNRYMKLHHKRQQAVDRINTFSPFRLMMY